MTSLAPFKAKILHGHIFCGIGGGAAGFNQGEARVGNWQAEFECVGGIDIDPAAIADFDRIAGVKGTVLDLFTREQYEAFFGKAPPSKWREAVPEDIRVAFGYRKPHILFLSAPCKGNSGLLPEARAKTAKYQALNGLGLRGVWLCLEAFKDDPVELYIFENVPRIVSRSRDLLDRIIALFRSHGYAVEETEHDCGEIGDGMAQSRKRYLMVARHKDRVPPFLYQPRKSPLKPVGSVLERLPLPGDPAGGPMHRMPALQWKTWVRLAFVEAGSDWRSLNRLNVENGVLSDFTILPEKAYHHGAFGVQKWEGPSGTVGGRTGPTNGNFSVADPRVAGHVKSVQLGVRPWGAVGPTVTGQAWPGQGPYAVADPRTEIGESGHTNLFRVTSWRREAKTVTGASHVSGGAPVVADPRPPGDGRFNNVFRVIRYDQPAASVTGGGGPSAGGLGVADPRPTAGHASKYRVTRFDEAAGTVIAASTTGQGAFALADPRLNWNPNAHRNKLSIVEWDKSAGTVSGSRAPYSGGLSVADPRPAGLSRPDRKGYLSGGHYGVLPWDQPCGAIPASTKNNNGPWSVADPRAASPVSADVGLPTPETRLVAVIIAEDGTWHRPFTTMELAALQSLLPDPESYLELSGLSDSAWRERIGNMVPPSSAKAVAGVMGRTLLMAWSGETFFLDNEPIWVQPLAMALSVERPESQEQLQ